PVYLPHSSPSCSPLYPLHFFFQRSAHPRHSHSFPTRRSSDLEPEFRRRHADDRDRTVVGFDRASDYVGVAAETPLPQTVAENDRSEEHTSELQSLTNLVCRLLLEKKKKKDIDTAGLPRLYTHT